MSNATAVFDLYGKANITWYKVMNNNVSSAAFAMLLVWSCSTLYKAIEYYGFKRKLIYGLNVLQAFFMLIKTLTATVYVVLLGVPCEPRAILLSIPLVFSIDCMYYIMLVKLLLFTPFRWAVRVVFFCALVSHAVINFVGVAQRTTTLSANGTCKDVYPLIYKQQYVIEIVLECFTAIVLVHGIALKAQISGQIVSATYSLLQQLRKNEHLRVFSVLIMIALKLFLTYYTDFLQNFDHLYFTHGVDQARSAIVCWALMRDYRKLVKSSSLSGSHQSASRPTGPSGKSEFGSHFSHAKANSHVGSHSSSQMGASPRVAASKAVDKRDPIFEDLEFDDDDCGIGKKELVVNIEAIKSTETIAEAQAAAQDERARRDEPSTSVPVEGDAAQAARP
ncbi:hypothetical protein HK105_203409 [Polyrhizophydium stewartii]|uniref:Integral membrane protein n=1 Tax=Polyrhizophydium stewartii TaxID=2732419 RepID=A0ABR4NBS4_9FUNG